MNESFFRYLQNVFDVSLSRAVCFSYGRCMFLGGEPYVSLKGNIKKFQEYCFLQQGVWGLCMIVSFLYIRKLADYELIQE